MAAFESVEEIFTRATRDLDALCAMRDHWSAALLDERRIKHDEIKRGIDPTTAYALTSGIPTDISELHAQLSKACDRAEALVGRLSRIYQERAL